MEILGGFKRLMYSVLSAVVTFVISKALFDWFNGFVDTQITNAGDSVSGLLQLLKVVANLRAYDILSLVLAIVAAILTFIKVVDD